MRACHNCIESVCRTLRPVATCGLPKLANANFMHGAHTPSKRRRAWHSPSFLEALRIMQPSRDYRHLYEFIPNGTLVPLPSIRPPASHAVGWEAKQPNGGLGGTEPNWSPEVRPDVPVKGPLQATHAYPAHSAQAPSYWEPQGASRSPALDPRQVQLL